MITFGGTFGLHGQAEKCSNALMISMDQKVVVLGCGAEVTMCEILRVDH
jgi:hypothetical protein